MKLHQARNGSDEELSTVKRLRPIISYERIIQTCVVVVGNKLQRQGNKALKKYQNCVFNEVHAIYFVFPF